jgi:hypothetical protein
MICSWHTSFMASKSKQNDEARELLADALAHLQIAANELEQAFLEADAQSPYLSIANRVDAIMRDIQSHWQR